VLPTVADVLALDAVRRGAPQVLAGADRLDTPVRWVHVIELAAAEHLLKGGEFVLSTGIALPPDPAGLARYVGGLASAGVSALAVELGSRYLRELPRALITAATAHQLPLIVLERETQFIAVTEAVHSRILAAQVAALRAAERLNQVFTDLAVGGASQDDIVRQASALAQAPVILEDLAHQVLACAGTGQEPESLLAGFAVRSRAVRVPERTGYDRASGWLVAMVGARAVDWGRLIFVLPGPPKPADSVLAERAATTLALARLTGGQPESPLRVAHRGILTVLAGGGYADPVDLGSRLAALGLPVAGHRLLPVILRLPEADRARADRARAGVVADLVAAACQDAAVPAITAALDGERVAVLLALPPEIDPDAVLTSIAARTRAAPLGSLGVGPLGVGPLGVGPLAHSLAEVPRALRDADDASGAAAASGADQPFVRIGDLRLRGLLYQLRDDPRVQAFTERELGPLLRQDEAAGTGLIRVLASYLQAGGNKAEAAQQARLARPTLYERLRRIEQLLGVSMESADSRIALHVALLSLDQRPPAVGPAPAQP